MPHLLQPRPILGSPSRVRQAQVDERGAAHEEELTARLVGVAVKLKQHVQVERRLRAAAVRAEQPRRSLARPPADLRQTREAGRRALDVTAEVGQLRRAPGRRHRRHVHELARQHGREHRRR